MKGNQFCVYKKKIKWIVSVCFFLTGIGSIDAQNITIGPAMVSYYYNSGSGQTIYNRRTRLSGHLWFDCLLCPLKYSAKQIRFLLNNGSVLDHYLGDTAKPFTTWDSINSKHWKNVWSNWFEFEWNSSYHSLYPNAVMNHVYKYAAPYIEAIYKDSAIGALLGIVHLELRTTLETNPVPPIIYSIGIAYSTNNGNKWTYCGNIITPQAQKTDGSTSSIRYHIGGGAYIIKKDPIKGDSIFVYYSEYPTGLTTHYLSFAKAKLANVLNAAENSRVNLSDWSKYNSSGLYQDPISGVGSPILSDIDLDTHNKAVYCKSIKKYLMLMGQWFAGESGSSLRMYSSQDGITWSKFWKIDNAVPNPHPTQKSPVTIGSYASFCAAPSDPEAADDFHEVGKVFYINYPKSLDPAIGVSWGNLYYKKIIATPDSSQFQEVPRAAR
jgi:hypothetical protein